MRGLGADAWVERSLNSGRLRAQVVGFGPYFDEWVDLQVAGVQKRESFDVGRHQGNRTRNAPPINFRIRASCTPGEKCLLE